MVKLIQCIIEHFSKFKLFRSVTLSTFVNMYFEDKKGELKERSVRNKKYMIESHIIPYFGTRKINEVAPADIIKWQNAMSLQICT